MEFGNSWEFCDGKKATSKYGVMSKKLEGGFRNSCAVMAKKLRCGGKKKNRQKTKNPEGREEFAVAEKIKGGFNTLTNCLKN